MTNINNHDNFYGSVIPVSDGVVTDDLDLTGSLAVISVGEVTRQVWIIGKTVDEIQDAPPMAAMARHLLQQSGMQIDLGHDSRKSACLQLLLELLQSQPIGRFPVIEAVFHSLLIIRIGKMTHMKQIGGDFIQFRA